MPQKYNIFFFNWKNFFSVERKKEHKTKQIIKTAYAPKSVSEQRMSRLQVIFLGVWVLCVAKKWMHPKGLTLTAFGSVLSLH